MVWVLVKTVYRGVAANRIQHAEKNGSLDEATPQVASDSYGSHLICSLLALTIWTF